MNKIFKVIFNKKTGTFVAVSELSKSQGKKSSTTSVLPPLMIIILN